MRNATIRLVQGSWAQVVPIAEQAAELFYGNLFVQDPSLIPLFRGNMRVQGQKLMSMIGAAVGKLNDLDTLVPVLRGLGQRHTGYGVQPKHYGTVGAALLKTLEQGLGDAFTAEVRTAWIEVYALVAQTMQQPCAVAEIA